MRLTLYDYTIAVNGEPWERTFNCVWEPVFDPRDGSVLAPVRQAGQWTLARDGSPAWERRFVQLWHPMFSPDGANLAAIVAPSFGNWTVAVNGTPWRSTFNELVSDAVFSPDGKRVAAIGKQNGSYHIIVDDSVWPQAFDMAWAPVFSPDGRQAAAKVEKNGKCTFAIDGRLWNGQAESRLGPGVQPRRPEDTFPNHRERQLCPACAFCFRHRRLKEAQDA